MTGSSALTAASAQLLERLRAEPAAAMLALRGVFAAAGASAARPSPTGSALATAPPRPPAQSQPAAPRAGPVPGVPSQGRPLATPGVLGPQIGAARPPQAPGSVPVPQNKMGLLAAGHNPRDPRLQFRRPAAALPPQPQGLQPAAETSQRPVAVTSLPGPSATPPVASNYLAVDPSIGRGPAAMLREYLKSEKAPTAEPQAPAQPSSLASTPVGASRAPFQAVRGSATVEPRQPSSQPHVGTHTGSGARPSGAFTAPPSQVPDDRAMNVTVGSSPPLESVAVTALPSSAPSPPTAWQGKPVDPPGGGQENGVAHVLRHEVHDSASQLSVPAPQSGGHQASSTPREDAAVGAPLTVNARGTAAGVATDGEARGSDAAEDSICKPKASRMVSGAVPMETEPATALHVGGVPRDPHRDRLGKPGAEPPEPPLVSESASVHVPSAQPPVATLTLASSSGAVETPRALASSSGLVESTFQTPREQLSAAVPTLGAATGGDTARASSIQGEPAGTSTSPGRAPSRDPVHIGQVPGEQKQAGGVGAEAPPEGPQQETAQTPGTLQEGTAIGEDAVRADTVGGPPEAPGDQEGGGAPAAHTQVEESSVKVESVGEAREGDGSPPAKEVFFDNAELARRAEELLRDLSPPPLPAPTRFSRKGVKRARHAPGWLTDDEERPEVKEEVKPTILYEAPLHPRMDDFESLPRQPWQVLTLPSPPPCQACDSSGRASTLEDPCCAKMFLTAFVPFVPSCLCVVCTTCLYRCVFDSGAFTFGPATVGEVVADP